MYDSFMHNFCHAHYTASFEHPSLYSRNIIDHKRLGNMKFIEEKFGIYFCIIQFTNHEILLDMGYLVEIYRNMEYILSIIDDFFSVTDPLASLF